MSCVGNIMRYSINRRDFLKRAGTAGLGLGLADALIPKLVAAETGSAPARKLGANDTINVAVIGTNSRGLAHVECLAGLPGVQIAYICDVDDRAIAGGIKAAAKQQTTPATGAKDFPKIREDKSLAAVTVATPDHGHTPRALLALAAGKHV